MATSGGNPSTFTKTIIDNGAAAGNFVSASQGDSTEPFLGGGGTITVISSGTQVCPGWTQATITGGSNYQPGNYITIPESVIGDTSCSVATYLCAAKVFVKQQLCLSAQQQRPQDHGRRMHWHTHCECRVQHVVTRSAL